MQGYVATQEGQLAIQHLVRHPGRQTDIQIIKLGKNADGQGVTDTQSHVTLNNGKK